MKCYACAEKMKPKKGSYHYTESGLDNVYLDNVTIESCKCGEESVVIPKIDELHAVIANLLLHKKTPLLGKEVRYLRKEMGLSGVDLGKLLGVSNVSISRWENGEESVGPQSERLVRVIYVQLMQERCKSVFPGVLPLLEEIKPKAGRKELNLNIKMPIKRHKEALAC